MKTIYILLTKSDSILSRIIHFITMDSYTHVSIAFDENLEQLYSSSRKNGRTVLPAGPCMEQISCGYYRKPARMRYKMMHKFHDYKARFEDSLLAL